MTPEPTPEVTATMTPVPTLNYYVEMTTPDGEPARMVREVSTGDYLVILLLFALLVSIWLMWFLDRLKGD